MKGAPDQTERVRRYVAFFESLEATTLDNIDQYFSPDVHFKDPFNNVIGRDAVRAIFEHMFKSTEAARFLVQDWICVGNVASIRWQFRCVIQEIPLNISGMSHVRMDAQGQVEEHIDYWDPAEGIYEKIPLIGFLMRSLKKRFMAAGIDQ